jgi:hypothetical protein
MQPGQSLCEECSTGQFQRLERQIECEACVTGSYRIILCVKNISDLTRILQGTHN